MTISTTTNRVSYAGNGTTTLFSFPYAFNADSDLAVILKNDTTGVETPQTLTTHYTVSGAGGDSGGSITMLTAPASGYTLVIYRDPARTQETDFDRGDSFPSLATERALDKLTQIAQRLDDLVARSVRLSDGFSATFSTALPELLPASKLLRVNAAGTGFELIGIADASVTDFDTLSPLAAKGDILGYNGASNGRLPVGSPGQVLMPNSSATFGFEWKSPEYAFGSKLIRNLGLKTSVGSSALTIDLTQADGSTDPSATGNVEVGFRSATITSGAYNVRGVTAALSLTVDSGATLGHLLGSVAYYIYVYLIDNAGTVELAVSSSYLDEGALHSTTAMSGSSSSASVLYSETARTNVPIRLVGRLQSTQTAVGTWAANMDAIALAPFKILDYSRVKVTTPNGHGSTNTMIRRFSVIEERTGLAIGYSDSASSGALFVINVPGLYNISYDDRYTIGSGLHGISKNSNQLTTSITTITAAHRLGVTATVANYPGNVSINGVYLQAGDLIRPHTDASPQATNDYCSFSISRIGNAA